MTPFDRSISCWALSTSGFCCNAVITALSRVKTGAPFVDHSKLLEFVNALISAAPLFCGGGVIVGTGVTSGLTGPGETAVPGVGVSAGLSSAAGVGDGVG